MYPAETSLIPITVAVARYLKIGGIVSFFGTYPYWYLGIPARFVSAPAIPLLLVLIQGIIPNLDFFSITAYLIIISFIFGVIGWGLLVGRIKKKKPQTIVLLTVIIYTFLPWKYLSSFALSDATLTIAKNLLPLILLSYWSYLSKRTRGNALVAVFATSLLLLVNTSILTILAVGISGLVLASGFKGGKLIHIEKKIKSSIYILLSSLAIVTLWYTPSYWVTILTNPSIGGAEGFKVIFRVLDLFKGIVPLLLAIVLVYYSGKIKNKVTVFSLTWLFTFLFLTIFRFIGDPDFWQDWSTWFFEIEIGVALISATVISELIRAKTKAIDDTIYNSKL